MPVKAAFFACVCLWENICVMIAKSLCIVREMDIAVVGYARSNALRGNAYTDTKWKIIFIYGKKMLYAFPLWRVGTSYELSTFRHTKMRKLGRVASFKTEGFCLRGDSVFLDKGYLL